MQRLEQGYLLQRQAFKETDARLKILCEHAGVVTGILRNVYQNNQKNRQTRAALQPSCLLEVGFTLKPGLAVLHTVDALEPAAALSPKALVLISYLQELLIYLLPEGAEANFMFAPYQKALFACISNKPNLLTTLREFEWQLLDSLGFSFDWSSCQQTGSLIEPEKTYRFIQNSSQLGFVESNKIGIFGQHILAMAEGDFSDEQTVHGAKLVFRRLVDAQLNGRPLRSRLMYQRLFAKK